jgi:NYN domain-containing protein
MRSVTDADAVRLAVLIDVDNTTASPTTELLEEIAKYGTPTIKRAYGDWTTSQLTCSPKRRRCRRRRPTAMMRLRLRRPTSSGSCQPRSAARRRTTAGPTSSEPYGEVKDVPGPTGLSQSWVRLKPTARNSGRTR